MNTKIDRKTMLIQRRILGILCIALGPCSLLFGLLGMKTNFPSWYMSISETYWCNSGMLNIGLLFATSIFFFSYCGYDKKDRIVSLIEAISSMLIIVFPCDPHQAHITRVGLLNVNPAFSQIMHSVFAAVLFIAYAYNITFLFTLSKGEKTEKKVLRNIVYYTTGAIIWIGIVLQALFVLNLLKIPATVPFTMINEIIMLIAFGGAYLVKSEAIAALND